MFYESCAVDLILKCAFCDLKFIDEIKIIPECGNSICGDCYEDLKSKFERKHQFDCRACDERHAVSIGTIGDNKSLLKMLQLRPKERGLTERAKLLKSFLQVVQEQVDELKQTNKQDEVNAYCDSLQMEVMETLESSIKHLNDIGASLLREIKDYRNHLLNERSRSQSKESSAENPEASFIERGTDQELEKLSAEIKQFSQEWADKIELIDQSFSDQEIQKADFKARDLYFKTRLLKTNLRREMFDGRFLRFKENAKFFQSHEYIGRMVCDDSERRNLVNTLNNSPIGEAQQTYTGHSNCVYDAITLPNGNLVTCSADKKVTVWDRSTGKMTFEHTGHSGPVFTMALLPNGWLASGSEDATIKLWNLDEQKLLRTLKGHTSAVISLQVLPDGNLASCSLDGTISTWNPYLSGIEICQILMVPGHQTTRHSIKLGLLSNGYLVTCSSVANEVAQVRIWNPANGQTVSSFSVGTDQQPCSLSSLQNDHIAVGFLDGSIKIFDLSDKPVAKILKSCHAGGVFGIIRLSSGLIISSGSSGDPTLKVWDPVDGDLLQTVSTGFGGNICSLSNSKCGKLLLASGTGSADKTLRTWALNQ